MKIKSLSFNTCIFFSCLTPYLCNNSFQKVPVLHGKLALFDRSLRLKIQGKIPCVLEQMEQNNHCVSLSFLPISTELMTGIPTGIWISRDKLNAMPH